MGRTTSQTKEVETDGLIPNDAGANSLLSTGLIASDPNPAITNPAITNPAAYGRDIPTSLSLSPGIAPPRARR